MSIQKDAVTPTELRQHEEIEFRARGAQTPEAEEREPRRWAFLPSAGHYLRGLLLTRRRNPGHRPAVLAPPGCQSPLSWPLSS